MSRTQETATGFPVSGKSSMAFANRARWWRDERESGDLPRCSRKLEDVQFCADLGTTTDFVTQHVPTCEHYLLIFLKFDGVTWVVMVKRSI